MLLLCIPTSVAGLPVSQQRPAGSPPAGPQRPGGRAGAGGGDGFAEAESDGKHSSMNTDTPPQGVMLIK